MACQGMVAMLCTAGLSRSCWYDRYDVMHLSEKDSVQTVRIGRSFCSADDRAHLIAFCMSSAVCSGCACAVPSYLHEYALCDAPEALSSGNGEIVIAALNFKGHANLSVATRNPRLLRLMAVMRHSVIVQIIYSWT